jgi:hypothetical protein
MALKSKVIASLESELTAAQTQLSAAQKLANEVRVLAKSRPDACKNDRGKHLKAQFNAFGMGIRAPDRLGDLRVYERAALIIVAEAEARRDRIIRMIDDEKLFLRFLGDNCPRLVRRLFQYLYQENQPPFSEWEVLDGVCGEISNRHETSNWKHRLSKIQQALNIRLARQKSGFSVIRPVPGKLQLVATTASKSEFLSVKDCMALVVTLLEKGPMPTKDLELACEQKKCRRSTVRNALSKLPIRKFPKGFGASCTHFVELHQAVRPDETWCDEEPA